MFVVFFLFIFQIELGILISIFYLQKPTNKKNPYFTGKGSRAICKPVECVLIFDGEKFHLEQVATAIKEVKLQASKNRTNFSSILNVSTSSLPVTTAPTSNLTSKSTIITKPPNPIPASTIKKSKSVSKISSNVSSVTKPKVQPQLPPPMVPDTNSVPPIQPSGNEKESDPMEEDGEDLSDWEDFNKIVEQAAEPQIPMTSGLVAVDTKKPNDSESSESSESGESGSESEDSESGSESEDSESSED